MDSGQINLGAKELSGNPLSCVLPEGFFYWRWRGSLTVVNLENFPRGKGQFDTDKPQSRCRPTARQHLILQTICRQRLECFRVYVELLTAVKTTARFATLASCLPASFQDNFLVLPVMINKPFQSGAKVNSPKKVNCCTGWNRIHSTTKSRMNNKRGHHAGTAKLKQCPGSGDRLRPGTPNSLG